MYFIFSFIQNSLSIWIKSTHILKDNKVIVAENTVGAVWRMSKCSSMGMAADIYQYNLHIDFQNVGF